MTQPKLTLTILYHTRLAVKLTPILKSVKPQGPDLHSHVKLSAVAIAGKGRRFETKKKNKLKKVSRNSGPLGLNCPSMALPHDCDTPNLRV